MASSILDYVKTQKTPENTRRFQLTLRQLFLLVGVAAILAFFYRDGVTQRSVAYVLDMRPDDARLTTEDFDVVFHDCGGGSSVSSSSLLVAGSGGSSGHTCYGDFRLEKKYAAGRLTIRYRETCITITQLRGQSVVSVNGKIVGRPPDRVVIHLAKQGELIKIEKKTTPASLPGL